MDAPSAQPPRGRWQARRSEPFEVSLFLAFLAIFLPAIARAQTFGSFLGMAPAHYDPSESCADMLPFCGPSTPTHAGGLGLRVVELYWREVYDSDVLGARFTLQYPSDWSVYEIEFCDGITPVTVGLQPGELFELDFGHCRTTTTVNLGRIVFNVRSRGTLDPDNQEARRCSGGWEETLSHGQVELGLACEIPATTACGFCGPAQVYVNPRRLGRVFLVGSSGSDTITASRQAGCINPGDCTPGITDCYGFARSDTEWATLTDLGGTPYQHTYRVDYLIQEFPPGRYQGGIRNQDDVCSCKGDCVALDIQVIEQVDGNQQPVARIRPFGAETNPVQFDGSASFDLDGSPLTYFWDFGDGETATGPMSLHSFATLGPATVTLVVSDETLDSTPDLLTFDVIPPAMPASVADPPPTAPGAPDALTLEVANPVVPGRPALRFTLPSARRIRLDVFDVAGHNIQIIREGTMAAGTHFVAYGEVTDRVPFARSGVFLVRLADGSGNVTVRKLLLLR